MALVKKWPFFHLFLSRNIDQEKCILRYSRTKKRLFTLKNQEVQSVFYDIIEQKNAFLAYKKKKIQKVQKTDIFPKGLVHGFGQKLANFPSFFKR